MYKMCIAVYVFGEDYQEYIPMYIYSILKSYPKYHIRIYLDKKLQSKIRNSLLLLNELGKFEIIEEYSPKFNLNKKALKNSYIQKSLRWFLFDEELLKYKYLYIGDVDVIFCNEKNEFCDQHVKHINFLGTPYSNISRKNNIKAITSPKEILKGIIKNGFKDTYKAFKKGPYLNKKLSGLHFIEVKPYYKAIEAIQEEVISELNRIFLGNHPNQAIYYLTDEVVLKYLVEKAGLKIPKVCKELKDMVLNENPNSYEFRPHHGLHLGVWRNKRNAKNSESYISKSLYINYYKQYENYKKDPIFINLLGSLSPTVFKIVKSMEDYYLNI